MVGHPGISPSLPHGGKRGEVWKKCNLKTTLQNDSSLDIHTYFKIREYTFYLILFDPFSKLIKVIKVILIRYLYNHCKV